MSIGPIPLRPGELAELSRRSDAPGLVRLAAHLGALAATGALLLHVGNAAALAALTVAHGVLLCFLFAPLHESVHGTAFRSRGLNRLAGWIGGAALVLPPGWFRHFHLAHHRHTQRPGRDPELATPKPRAALEYARILSGAEYWTRVASALVRHAAGKVPEPFVPARRRGRVVLEARIFLAFYVGAAALSIALGSDWFWRLWALPVLLGQPFLRAFLLAEHWGCPDARDMWANTRSTVSNRAVRLLAWNMPFHAEHHAHPNVPFHALPELARRARARRVESPGYLPFHLREAPALVRRGEGL